MAGAQAQTAPTDVPARDVEPVVLQGAQLAGWSRSAAQGLGKTLPEHVSADARDAHNGTLIVPPDARPGVPVDEIVAYKWNDTGFVEIPVQVDERFPYFLSNARSDSFFGPVYSSTDEELTYEWDVESWKMIAGECQKAYPEGEGPMEDPVTTLDDDDEVVVMASDAGGQAPLGVGPHGTTGEQRQEIRLVDPRDPTAARYVYLFQNPDGSSFDSSNGYVRYERDANADEWIDRWIYKNGEPENLGSSNTGYGPNLEGTVCGDDTRTPDVVETSRQSTDRFARDGVTVSTAGYRWYASGRWMVRSMQIAKAEGMYGPDLIDRWKGRAFQQNPDSSISVVGFEDEQVNWEANSALLGELQGPVRAIREIWGADSGTNVTKTETFYRNSIQYRYRVRVHPIPPDGLYTSWDYNYGVADCYFNESHSECIEVDGVNDDELNVDQLPNGQPAYFDATDPRHSKPLANLNWEQVSGADDAGSLVYIFEMESPLAAENPLVVPYYRDDKCFDDGTGDDPSPRNFPGETSTDPRVYPEEIRQCDPDDPDNWQNRQGCFACHGIHYFVTNDTDNATLPKPVTEIDGAQWQWAVPTETPEAIGDAYANTVKIPLVAAAVVQPSTPQAPPSSTPTPTPTESTASPTPTPAGPVQTHLEFVDTPSSAQFSDEASFTARLTEEGGAPVVGAPVTFALTSAEGTRTFDAVTDGDGLASTQTTLTERPGAADLRAHYEGDADHVGSSAWMGYDVAKEDTTLSAELTGKGSKRSLGATLVDADSNSGIADRTIEFSADGVRICESASPTSAQGRATCDLPPRYQGGHHTYSAVFQEDDYYLTSSTQTSS